MEFNKRGQGLSVNAIILIVLGVVVLAVLVLGFTVGWQKILPFVSTNNVDTLVTTCGVACSTNSQFDFCITKRDLKAGDDSIKDVTCNYLAEEQKKYGVDSCSSVSCDNVAYLNTLVENAEGIDCVDNPGKTVYALSKDEKTLLSKDCPLT